jgi:hypothetical protein
MQLDIWSVKFIWLFFGVKILGYFFQHQEEKNVCVMIVTMNIAVMA